MNYVGRILSNFRDFYKEINTATLTGAIDVVVVEKEDGTYSCSPFHVRFGKMGVLRSREKLVDIEINGEPVELHMKLGETGEAFFVEETQGEVPEYLATSPIPSVTQLMENGLKKLHQTAEEENLSENIYPIPDLVKARSDSNLPSGNQENVKNSSSDTTLLINSGLSLATESAALSPAAKKVPPSPNHSNESQRGSSFKKSKSRKKRRKSGKGGKSGKSKKPNFKEKVDSDSSHSDDLLSSDQSPSRAPAAVSKMKTTPDSHLGEEAIFDMDLTEEEEIHSQKDGDGSNALSSGLAPPSHSSQVDDEVKLHSINYQMRDYHPFSDGDLTPCISPSMTRSPTPIKSDTEVDYQKINMEEIGPIEEDQVQWKWGELPEKFERPESKQQKDSTSSAEQGSSGNSSQQKQSYLSSMWQYMRRTKKIRHSSKLDGIYLDELKLDELDPEVTALYFPQKGGETGSQADQAKEDVVADTLNMRDYSVSPISDEGEGARSVDSGRHSAIDTIESGQSDASNIMMSLCGGLKSNEDIPEDIFLSSIVTYEDFMKNPGILGDTNLVVKYENRYYNWQTAAPIILSLVAFQRPLPQDVVDSLVQATKKSEKYSWFPWRRPSKSVNAKDDQTDSKINKSPNSSPIKKEIANNKVNEVYASDEEQSSSKDHLLKDYYKKTIRLNSDQLASLKLRRGANEAAFSVTTQYQGTSQCNCTIYLWRYNDKIVVSDIDGTITKSDALGQILPVFGKDWTQSGVASLYSSIQNNGYQFLYLSARAIGQAGMTRGYLNSVKQGEIPLPDGPLLLTPTSLIRAFQKEVIERKPEEFKISCLGDIKDLFPINPFHSGFGNRINDVWAYTAVGIPLCRIFTIDTKGVLHHELTQTFQSSYSQLSDLVDHLFPPLPDKTLYQFDMPDKYSSFTFWREPLPEVKTDM